MQYYKENKEKILKMAGDQYSALSEEEKNKRREYRRNRFWNCLKKTNKMERIGKEYRKNMSEEVKKITEKIIPIMC